MGPTVLIEVEDPALSDMHNPTLEIGVVVCRDSAGDLEQNFVQKLFFVFCALNRSSPNHCIDKGGELYGEKVSASVTI